MTSLNKKAKCKKTLYDRGGEKGRLHKWKGIAMFHKKNRVQNNKACNEEN